MQAKATVDHERLWGALFLAGLFVVAVFPYHRLDPSVVFCPFKRWSLFPCFMCGGTRAARALSELDVAAAFAMNPLVTLGAFAAGAYLIHAAAVVFFGRRAWRPDFRSGLGRHFLRLALPLLLMLNWCYLIAVER